MPCGPICPASDALCIAGFKMWKGGGGVYLPSLFWEASEAKNGQKMIKNVIFFGKIIAQKRCKYQCFCFLRLVAMESVL